MGKKKWTQTKKRSPKNGDGKAKVYLEKWQVVLAFGVFLLMLVGLIVSFFVPKGISEKQLEHYKTQFEYSTGPNCALQFVPARMKGSTKAHFLLRNHGPGRLDDVWLKETVFLVDSGGVHECLDLPHFEYFYYCGHIASMGSLYVGKPRRIDLPPCWTRPIDLFFRKFSGNLVSRFRLTGTALASPEFRKDFFFVIDRSRFEYVSPDEYIGGKELVESAIAYVGRGPRSIIRWVSFGDFHDFFRNPPKFFYQPDGRNYVPWNGPGLPPISPATIPIYFSRYTVLPTEVARLNWFGTVINSVRSLQCSSVAPVFGNVLWS